MQTVKELKKYTLLSKLDANQTKVTAAINGLVRMLTPEVFDCIIYNDITEVSGTSVYFDGDLKKDADGFSATGPFAVVTEVFEHPGIVMVIFSSPTYSKGAVLFHKKELVVYEIPDTILQVAQDIVKHLTTPTTMLRLM